MKMPSDYSPYHHTPHPQTTIPATHMESHGNSRLWTEPDFLPKNMDAELPMLSTVGRGPRGEGVVVECDETDDSCEITFRSDLTGEVLFKTDNLNAGIVSVHQIPSEEACPGQPSTFYVDITRGGQTQSYPVTVNAGAQGSRIYMVKDGLKQEMSHPVSVFDVDIDDLTFYGVHHWGHLPPPRPSDAVLAVVNMTDGSVCLAAGTVMAVTGRAVTVVIRILMPTRTPYIKDGNWWVGDVDTGVSAGSVTDAKIAEIVEEKVDEIIDERIDAALTGKDLLTKEEVSNLIDEKIDKVNYYISDDGVLIRQIED